VEYAGTNIFHVKSVTALITFLNKCIKMDYIQNTGASSNVTDKSITDSIQVTLNNKLTYCNLHSHRGFVMECQAHTQKFSLSGVILRLCIFKNYVIKIINVTWSHSCMFQYSCMYFKSKGLIFFNFVFHLRLSMFFILFSKIQM